MPCKKCPANHRAHFSHVLSRPSSMFALAASVFTCLLIHVERTGLLPDVATTSIVLVLAPTMLVNLIHIFRCGCPPRDVECGC